MLSLRVELNDSVYLLGDSNTDAVYLTIGKLVGQCNYIFEGVLRHSKKNDDHRIHSLSNELFGKGDTLKISFVDIDSETEKLPAYFDSSNENFHTSDRAAVSDDNSVALNVFASDERCSIDIHDANQFVVTFSIRYSKDNDYCELFISICDEQSLTSDKGFSCSLKRKLGIQQYILMSFT